MHERKKILYHPINYFLRQQLQKFIRGILEALLIVEIKCQQNKTNILGCDYLTYKYEEFVMFDFIITLTYFSLFIPF